MLVTLSPARLALLSAWVFPSRGAEPPTDAVMPPMDEVVRLFAGYGCEILGPPVSLDDLF
jgi:hypothetical protein